MLASPEGALVVLVDLQPNFLAPIFGADNILRRCQFLLEVASLLHVPIIATEQYPHRMGGTDERLETLLKSANAEIFPKMTFSCAGCPEFSQALASRSPKQVVLIGIETHICVNQTAHHLIEQEIPVILGADAIGARSEDMHRIGIERMRSAGAIVAHTESIAYEWLGTADVASFRDMLKIVKAHA